MRSNRKARTAFEQGRSALGRRGFDMAIAEFIDAIRLDPKSAHTYCWLCKEKTQEAYQ